MEFYRLDIGLKLDLLYLLEGTIKKCACHVGFSHSSSTTGNKMQLKGPVCKIYYHLVVRQNIAGHVNVNPSFLMAVTAAVMSG